MRNSRYTQLFATTALSAMFLIAGVTNADAQNRETYTNRSNIEKKHRPKKEWSEKDEKRYHHENYDKERWHRNDHSYHQDHGRKKHKKDKKYKKHNKHDKHYGNSRHHDHGKHYGHKKQHHGSYYSDGRPNHGYYREGNHSHNNVYYGPHHQVHHHRVYHVNHHDCYNHPDHGRVVVQFGVEPVVIRHQHGDYFYVDGCYYRHYPNIGYVVVEAPRKVYFEELPRGCERVHHRHSDYYIQGDLCFERHGTGFRLVARPSGLNISVKF